MARIQVSEHVWVEDRGYGLYAEAYDYTPAAETITGLGQLSIYAAASQETQQQFTEQPTSEVAP